MIHELHSVVQHLRKQAQKTQEELAREAGISYSTLAKIERGAIKDPSFGTIVSLAKALDQPIQIFSDGLTVNKNGAPVDDSISFVYCDVNGVLVRFYQRAFVSLAEKIHRDVNQVETAFWHYNAAVNKGEMTTAQFNQAVAKRLRVESIDWKTEYLNSIESVNAMHDCLRAVIKHCNVGLLTNIFPNFIDNMISRGLLPDLPYATIIDSSEVGAIKPEPEMYRIAEKEAGVNGSNILFIDDSRTNLMEAEKHNWHVLWFDDYRPEESVKRVMTMLDKS